MEQLYVIYIGFQQFLGLTALYELDFTIVMSAHKLNLGSFPLKICLGRNNLDMENNKPNKLYGADLFYMGV